MKLKEALAERKGQMAKIGSGNSFVYCGVITDDLCELLEKMSDDEYKRISDRLRKFEIHKNRFDHIWSNKLETMTDEFYKNVHAKHLPIDMVEQKHKKLMEKYEKEKAVDRRLTESNISHLTKIIAEWSSFTERKVKEIYPSLEQGEIIIFKGYESGRYWTYEEYEEDNR